MDGWGLARLQKLLQRFIPDPTGFFPRAKLVARLFHGKATSFAVDFPGIPFWRSAAVFHFHPKFSIEVWLHHNVPSFTLSIVVILANASVIDLSNNDLSKIHPTMPGAC
jgi:hypothetical protein